MHSPASGLLSLVTGAASDATVFGEVSPGLVIDAAVSLGQRNPRAGTWKWLITSLLWLRVYHQHQPQHLSAPGSGATYPSFPQVSPPTCRQCPKTSVCFRGLPAAQCSPPHPPTPSSQARLSLLSCGPCQEKRRKVPSCSPWALGRVGCRLPGVGTGLVPHCAEALPWRQPVSIVQVPQT